MVKECPTHGVQKALMDPDASIVMNHYNTTTEGINKAVLVPITSDCNLKCSWCFTEGVKTIEHDAAYYSKLLIDLKIQGYTILLSGGEPTARKDFLPLCKELIAQKWPVVTMSNMLKFSELSFMQECIDIGMIYDNTLMADFSMQHPKNYNGEIVSRKYMALANLEKLGVKANCVQFSISSLDELDFIREFYNNTKNLYNHMRIRTLFGFWKDKSKKIYLSELYQKFRHVFGDLTPTQSTYPEKSNIYSIYLNDGNCGISLSSSPTLDNLDLLSARRPTLALATDDKYYSLPVAQIISEGIEKGWYNGFKINKEVSA